MTDELNDCQAETCPYCGGKGYIRDDGDNFQICDCVEIWPNETAAHASGFEMGYRAHGEVVAAELSRLQAEIAEAREIIGESREVFDMLSNELIPEIASLLESMGLPDHANRVRAAMVYSNDDLPRRARAFLEKADG